MNLFLFYNLPYNFLKYRSISNVLKNGLGGRVNARRSEKALDPTLIGLARRLGCLGGLERLCGCLNDSILCQARITPVNPSPTTA